MEDERVLLDALVPEQECEGEPWKAGEKMSVSLACAGSTELSTGSAQRGAQIPHIRSDALGAWLTSLALLLVLSLSGTR